MELIKIGIFLCAGIAIGFIIPNIVQKMIQYKCAKRNQSFPVFCTRRQFKPLQIFLSASLFTLAGWKMPFAEAFLVCCFVVIAITATMIDIRIRIIANETVLALMILGILYRTVAGGVHSLPGSVAALALIFIIFGGSALINKGIMKSVGVGAGDVKLSMAVAIAVGYPGVFFFLGGMAVAIAGYCIIGLMLCLLTPKSTFPMCGHIMIGFLVALFTPYFPLCGFLA